MSSTNGYEYTSRHPDWTQKDILDKFNSEEFKRLFGFYVICNPYAKSNCSKKNMVEYGWGNIRIIDLKKYLLYEVGLQEKSIFSKEKINEMKIVCANEKFGENFNDLLDTERAVICLRDDNIVKSLFNHIRNAFAHGRFAVCDYNGEKNSRIVLEDVDPDHHYQKTIAVSARMVLKKSTLLKWIDIIEAGPDSEEYQQYLKSKQKGKKQKKEKKTDV